MSIEKIDLKNIESIPNEIIDTIKEITELTKNFNPVELYTADNLEDKKKEFLKKVDIEPNFNPTFTYNKALKRFEKSLGGVDIKFIKEKLKNIQKKINTIDLNLIINKEENEEVYLLSRIAKIIINKKIKDDLLTIKIVEGMKNNEPETLKDAFKQKYGTISDDIYKKAEYVYNKILNNNDVELPCGGIIPNELLKKMNPKDRLQDNPDKLLIKEKEGKRNLYYNAEDISNAFKWVLDEYYKYYKNKTGKDIPEHIKLKININNECSGIDVRDKSSAGAPTIYIPENRIITSIKMIGLLAHEIEGHVRESLNGVLMWKELGGGIAKIDDEVLYEGLAMDTEDCVNKKLFGKKKQTALPYYVFAIKLAQEGKSFNEVFKEIRKRRLATPKYKNMSKDTANKEVNSISWITTYRAFRGGAGMSKDKAYFEGYILQKQLKKEKLDYLNQAAILQKEALPLLARLNFTEKDLPFPFLNITEKYVKEVMMPNRFGKKWDEEKNKFINIKGWSIDKVKY